MLPIRPIRRVLVAAILAASLPTASPLAAQGKTEEAGFIVRLGSDTLGVEQFARSTRRLESEVATRVPHARRIHYVASLDSLGRIARFDVTMRPVGGGGPGAMRGVVVFAADSAEVSVTRGDSTQRMRVAAPPGTIPLTAFSEALLEQAIRQARRSGGDSVAFAWLPLGAADAFPSAVVRRGKDSVYVELFGGPVYARVDKRGRLLGADARATTQKFLIDRVKRVNVGAWATAFARAEAVRGPAGQLSPRDTLRAEVAGAHLFVDYGRPRRRGREIFGRVVPWSQVWRTGANAATGLTTDADISVGGTTVPRGSYTLWTIPSTSGGELIVNTQTGQWGTEYDSTRDLVRVPMSRESLAAPVEQFTIAIEPRQDGALLRLSWDTTSFTVPVRVRQN